MYGSFTTHDSSIYGRPLGSGELRLLRPVSISQHSLSFSLTSSHRRAAPRYTAVSYTWGIDQPTESITLNGQRFAVRPNLWSCLYYLGQEAGKNGWSHLWADAICINQNDDAERNAQVQRMDQTYRDAARVSVWLGLPTLTDEQLATTNAYLKTMAPKTPIKTLELDPFEWTDHVQDLADRAYWTRFWVIQEFLLATDVSLHCSNTSMSWLDFQDILKYSANQGAGEWHRQEQDLALGRPYRVRAGATTAEVLVMSRHPDKFPEILQPLHHLLVEHRHAKCKDPRDRVFALLGLVTADERRWLERFFPDYALSEHQVLVIAVAHVVQCQTLVGHSPGRKITHDSRELFEGLGVSSKAQAKKLLRQAERIDYIGAESKAEIIHMMEWITEAPGSVGDDESGDHVWGTYGDDSEDDDMTDRNDATSSSRITPAVFLIFGVFILLIVALKRFGKHTS